MITDIDKQIETFQRQFALVTNEMAKRIVGYQDIVEGVLLSLLADGHVLLEGIPGLGKTKLVHTLSDVLHLKFARIQFTPDLMPADITGTNVVQETKQGEKNQSQKKPENEKAAKKSSQSEKGAQKNDDPSKEGPRKYVPSEDIRG